MTGGARACTGAVVAGSDSMEPTRGGVAPSSVSIFGSSLIADPGVEHAVEQVGEVAAGSDRVVTEVAVDNVRSRPSCPAGNDGIVVVAA